MDLPDIVSADESNFEYQVLAYSEQVPVLVLFWAQWCLTCGATNPLLETLTEEHPGKFRLAKVDVDSNSAIAAKFGIMSIPSLIFFKNGEEVDRVIGAIPKSQIESKVNKALGNE